MLGAAGRPAPARGAQDAGRVGQGQRHPSWQSPSGGLSQLLRRPGSWGGAADAGEFAVSVVRACAKSTAAITGHRGHLFGPGRAGHGDLDRQLGVADTVASKPLSARPTGNGFRPGLVHLMPLLLYVCPETLANQLSGGGNLCADRHYLNFTIRRSHSSLGRSPDRSGEHALIPGMSQ